MSQPKKRLDAVAEILMGQAPPGESYNLEGDGWPLLAGAGDFKGDHPVAKKFTTEAARISMPGDIVIGVRASIGDKVVADQEYCLGRGVAALRARSELHDRYLWHWLSSIKPSLEAKGKGATFKQVTKEDIAELEIPLPPLEEQRRIAAILDKADSLQSKRRRCLGHIDLLLKSTFIDMFGDPVSNSMGWESGSLVESLDLINGRAFKSSEWSNSGLPIIRIQNVKRPEEVFNRYLGSWESKHLVKKGDILLCWAGQLVSIGVHQWDREDGLLNQHIFKVIPKFEAEPKFIAFMLSLVIDQAKTNFRGTDMKHLTKADLARQTIILPPISIQRRFALFADCMESMRVSQVSHLERINSVSSSLTTLAFHGSFSRWSGDEIVCA